MENNLNQYISTLHTYTLTQECNCTIVYWDNRQLLDNILMRDLVINSNA